MAAIDTRWRWWDLPLRFKLLVILAIPLIPLLLTGALLYAGQKAAEDAEEDVDRTLVTKAQLDQLLTAVVESELAARSAVLTRSPEAYELYGIASAGVLQGVKDLGERITDPAQRGRLEDLATVLQGRPLDQIVEYARATPGGAAPPLTLLAQSRSVMGDVRRSIAGMHEAQDALLSARSARARAVRRWALGLTIGGIVLGLVGSIAAAAAFTRSVADRLALVGANARRVVEGQTLLPMPAHHDEVGELSASLHAAAGLLERRNAEIRRRIEEISAANRELEAFSYSVSHDLRAPLRHITGFATLLEKRAGDSLDDGSRRYVRTIVDSAARMGRLVDDLLSFSRMGRIDLLRNLVDLNELVVDARREVEADVPHLRIEWAITPLPAVIGDRAMLRLVLVNLLSNAVKYSASRDIVEVEVGAQARPGEHVIYVRDHGVGFDMTYVDKLFGVFQRLHSSDDFEGTGIGLANVRRIIQRHGGQTWAEGSVGHGATFYFSLPNDERARTA